MLICALLYLISSAIGNERIESLIQEDQNVKRRRERYQKQSSLLSKLTRQLSIHDNRAAAASSYSDNGSTGKFIRLKQFFIGVPTPVYGFGIFFLVYDIDKPNGKRIPIWFGLIGLWILRKYLKDLQ